MRVVITGVGGFVGRVLTTTLLAAGHDVVGLTRSGSVPAGAEVVTGSVLDPDLMTATLAGADAVCHLAARARVRESRADPLGFWRTNLEGTRVLLDACPKGARVVLASTASVHAVPDGEAPITEDTPLDPPHPYAATKLAADLLARDVALTGRLGAVSLRVFNAAGPGDTDTSRMLPALLARAGAGAGAGAGGSKASLLSLDDRFATSSVEPFVVNGDGSAVRDLVHVADLADAFVAAVGLADPGTWRPLVLGSGRGTSVAGLVATVERVTGRTIPVRRAPPADEPARLVADPARARAALDWTPWRSEPDRIVADAWTALDR